MPTLSTQNMNRMVRRHKSALTRAKNSGDPQKILDACDKAFADFDTYGYPDCWHTWNIARQDAELAKARAEWQPSTVAGTGSSLLAAFNA